MKDKIFEKNKNVFIAIIKYFPKNRLIKWYNLILIKFFM